MFAADFSRFSDDSFEKLVRAICFERFGTSGLVFSKGPDGARDFCLEGKVAGYESRGWDGYLIVQSKFKDAAGVNPVPWLSTQLRRERAKFEDRSLGYRSPEYYIVATNVHLSGAKSGKKTGGFAKIKAELDDWKAARLIKDFDIWAADKIDDFLLASESIRRSFAAWAPGDVLTKVMDRLFEEEREFAETIRRSLVRHLKRDKFVRLQDAGSVSDLQVRAGQVFIDLPISDLLNQKRDKRTASQGLVATVVNRAMNKFNRPGSVENIELGERSKNKIVLLGGPGQGKSTASLFVAQLFRCALLSDHSKRDAETTSIIDEVEKRAKREGINTNIPRRYPVNVSLPAFADAISRAKQKCDEPPSLLMYICTQLAGAGDAVVERSKVRRWMREYPWIVILDGFDEVPASGERHAVLDAISQFESEAFEADADVLSVLTSRPQGYNQALSTQEWEHWWLVDLPTEKALAYAKDLSLAQYPEDETRRENLSELLRDASKRPATSRLMVSPLQITILHTIVDTGGSVPTARWTLFNDYFEVLKRREKAKGGQTKKIIEKHINYIGPIHQRVGLLLQVESERKGRAGSALSEERFKNLLERYLREEGYEGAELSSRVVELNEVALQRFVLLSTREEGAISFDVRSLQEYMAAAALTTGPTELLGPRLAAIVGNAHWRHVFLIAASRCFSEDTFHHMREVICHVPRNLEVNSIPDLVAGNGAQLALEMFSDGIGADYPNFRRVLAKHALEMLQFGAMALDARLRGILEPETREIVETEIHSGEQSTGLTYEATWKLRLWLSDTAVGKSLGLQPPHIPAASDKADIVLNSLDFPLTTAELVKEVSATVQSLGPSETRKRLAEFLTKFDQFRGREESHNRRVREARESGETDSAITRNADEPQTYPRHYRLFNITNLIMGRGFRASIRVLSANRQNSFECIFGSLQTDRSRFLKFKKLGLRDEWEIFNVAAEFLNRPSKTSLREALSVMSLHFKTAKDMVAYLPWPIASAIAFSESKIAIQECSSLAMEGYFGDSDDWLAAERRWKDQGLREKDFRFIDGRTWFDASIASVGCPYFSSWTVGHNRDVTESVANLASVVATIDDPRVARILSRAVNFGTLSFDDDRYISPELAPDFLKCLETGDWRWHAYLPFALDPECWRNGAIVERIGTWFAANGFTRYLQKVSLERVVGIVDAFKRHPAALGLLVPIAQGLLALGPSGIEYARQIPRESLDSAVEGVPKLAAMTILALLNELPIARMEDYVNRVVDNRAMRVADKLADFGMENGPQIEMLTLLTKALRKDSAANELPIVDLRRKLEERQSKLANPACWQELRLSRQIYEMVF